MSKKPKTKGNDFKYASADLIKLKSIKTNWDLKKLYYQSETDPQIEKDLKKAERAYASFAKKWRKCRFTANTKLLKQALTEYELLLGLSEASKAVRYFGFRTVLNARDDIAQKQLALITRRLRKCADKILFFTLELGKIPKARQTKLLRSPDIAHFHYYLKRVFISAKYHLSEAEEKIISLKSSQSYDRWVEAVEKIISNRTVRFKSKTVAIPEALETVDLLNSKDKKHLWKLLVTEFEQIGEVAEHEFNAIITDVRTEEELRGYKKPYSSTAIRYEDSEKSIENLVTAVSTKGFALSRKFYQLKAKYHGLKQLHYTQKYDSIGSSLTIPFAQAVEICRDVFYGVHNEYGVIFDQMLTNGQLDVYPKPGKRGGAFMSDQTGHPVHVFLNHKDNFKSLETLAHEMGHAIHAHRSAINSPFYDGHSITTAETASTLFENLMFEAVFKQASDKDKPILLHDRITRDIATIQRQIAFFNCELEIHNTIFKNGAMTNDELRDCMQKHLQSYLGEAVKVSQSDGYSYIQIPHLRYGFYVYTYSFGILMSTIMANHYKADSSYVDKIDQFLRAGESDSVANIFKSIGINTSRPDTFLMALKNHENDIRAFEKFTKSRG